MAARILIIEDDNTIGSGLVTALESNGYDVDWIVSGLDGLHRAEAERPDLVLLDLGLPDLDGIEVCRRLRSIAPDTTIVMLTARREEIDVVVGLEAGADDYLMKPFRVAELLARLRAHLRRPRPGAVAGELSTVRIGELHVDVGARRATLAGIELDLRPKEFDVLAYLAASAGRAITRERLMADIWDEHWFGSTKTLDTHISALRRKLDAAASQRCRITTLRGVGYRLEMP